MQLRRGLNPERKMQVMNGLNYLHQQHKNIHRDLKPANVLVNSAGFAFTPLDM